jgi:hypothetical protein
MVFLWFSLIFNQPALGGPHGRLQDKIFALRASGDQPADIVWVWSTADICHKSEEKHGNIYGKSSENDGT